MFSTVKKIPNLEEITQIKFEFCRSDGSYSIIPVSLLSNGEIDGIYHANESRWSIDDEKLFFFHKDGRVSTLFSKFFMKMEK